MLDKILHLTVIVLIWFALYLAVSALYAGTGSALMVVSTFLVCTGILLYIDLRRDNHDSRDEDR